MGGWLKNNAAVLALAVAVVGVVFFQIESIRTELRSDRAAVSAELRSDRAAVSTELRSDRAAVSAELRSDRAAVSADVREIRQSVAGLVSAIHANDKRIDRLEQARR